MKKTLLLWILLTSLSCAHTGKNPNAEISPSQPHQTGTLKVNGTDIYYEIFGSGEPLVLIHGGGSDMYVSFGKAFPFLAKKFMVIAIDEQGHGRSPASSRAFGFEQTADDVAEVLKQLKVEKAHVLGFSNGATTGMYLAIRHPRLVNKMVLGSGLYSRNGAPKSFWDMMKKSTLESMPQELKDAYVKRSPRPEDLIKMYTYDSTRMKNFKSIPETSIRKVQAPTLIMQNDQDVATLEHGLHITRALPQGRFAVIPGTHDNFLGNVTKASPELTQASLTIITEYLQSSQ